MREPVCLDWRLRMPFKLVMPPTQKLPSSETQSRLFLKSRLRCPSKEPTGSSVCGFGTGMSKNALFVV